MPLKQGNQIIFYYFYYGEFCISLTVRVEVLFKDIKLQYVYIHIKYTFM